MNSRLPVLWLAIGLSLAPGVLPIRSATPHVNDRGRRADTARDQWLDRLLDEIQRVDRDSAVVAPTRDELARVEALFRRSLDPVSDPQRLRSEWNRLGYRLVSLHDERIWIAVETDDHRRGRGIYAWRTDESNPLVVQAPHRWYDLRTGRLAALWFAEGRIKAACWNSVHRRRLDLPDVTHHYFNAFTRAVSRHDPSTAIVQLHGFGSARQGVPDDVDMIISDGTRYPGRFVRDVALRLEKRFGRNRVSLYPLEVQVLGGTQNAQGQLLRSRGHTRFIHLELSASMRKTLAKSASQRDRLYACFGDPTGNQNVSPARSTNR